MANSVNPDQTAPIGSGSTLFASLLNSSVILCTFLQQTTSADDIFLGAFFACLVNFLAFVVIYGFFFQN